MELLPEYAAYEDGNSCNICLQSPAADVLIKGELRTLCREHMREALENS